MTDRVKAISAIYLAILSCWAAVVSDLGANAAQSMTRLEVHLVATRIRADLRKDRSAASKLLVAQRKMLNKVSVWERRLDRALVLALSSLAVGSLGLAAGILVWAPLIVLSLGGSAASVLFVAGVL